MYEITNRQVAPYASICYIRCDWSDGTSTRASGVIIGFNDVLTALHVVFDAQRGGWATRVVITPGADTDPRFAAPYGSFSDVGALDGRSANWDLDGDGLLTDRESQGDLVVLGMNSRIGDIAGWVPVINMPGDFDGLMVGYPARGTGMMAQEVRAHAESSATVYDIAGVLGPGASGGPLLYTDAAGRQAVAGVLSAGDDSSSTYAGLFGADTWNWLQAALAKNDSLLGLPPGSSPSIGLTLSGTSAADNMVGSTGRDTFTGFGGNDLFDGGGGIDMATYRGLRGAYEIAISGDTLTVRDMTAGRDGTDTLRSVERLKFTDFHVAFDTAGEAGQAYRLYRAALDRAPEPAGLGYHMRDLDNGVYIATVAAHFIESPEFKAAYGGLTDEQFVNRLYLNVLDRAGEPDGVAYHVRALQAGATRADVLVGFSESPENQLAVIGTIQGGMVYTL